MSNTINVNYMTRAYNQYQQKIVTKDQEKEDTRFADSVKEKREGSGSIVGNLKTGSVSAKDMTMEEYKQYIYNKISKIPMHPTRAGESISVTISEAGFEAMKNDPEYEAWVLNDLQVGWSQPDKWSGICGGAFSTIYYGASKEECHAEMWSAGYNVCGRALAPSKRVKGDILLCYSSRIEENSPCKSNRVEIAKVEDAIMKTVNMYATVYLDEKGIKRAGKSKEVSPEEKIATLEKKVKSLSSKKMMLYSDYKDDKLTREEYVKRSKAMVEQIDELHQEIEQLKTEIPPEDNSSSKFETQLESIINMESFDREKIQKVIKKVIINGEDNIEIVWNTDDPFFK